jgi:queuine/archaeosine tRNA-ribosyltransferase
MIKDDIQASINMCSALEIKQKVKLTGVIDTLKRAKKVEELLDAYRNHHYHLLQGNVQPMLRLRERIQKLEEELE